MRVGAERDWVFAANSIEKREDCRKTFCGLVGKRGKRQVINPRRGGPFLNYGVKKEEGFADAPGRGGGNENGMGKGGGKR